MLNCIEVSLTFILACLTLNCSSVCVQEKCNPTQQSDGELKAEADLAKTPKLAALSRLELIAIVRRIQKADFEDDLPVLQRLSRELGEHAENQELAGAVHYWRGFANWRRALNGFNDGIDEAQLDSDLTSGAHEFSLAASVEPAKIEALIGETGCEMSLIFLHYGDPVKRQIHIDATASLFQQAANLDQDNPRLLWLRGTSLWNRPKTAGGDKTEAWEAFQRGLRMSRIRETSFADPLQPTWGEPEILMSMAWSSFHASPPDLPAAESYALQSLALHPNWHYVAAILLPQIKQARAVDQQPR